MSIKVFECGCYGEGLSVEADEDGVVISQWRTWRNGPALFHRLKDIWRLLTRGYFDQGEVIFAADTAEEFASAVLDGVIKSRAMKSLDP